MIERPFEGHFLSPGERLRLDDESFRHVILRRQDTRRDVASGIHAVFGEWRKEGFQHADPRPLLRESYGTTFAEFQKKVEEDSLCLRFKKHIWHRLVKPSVCVDLKLESSLDILFSSL